MKKWLLLFAIILTFSACRKEEETADFYCEVNNEKWIVYNSIIKGTGLDVTVYNWQQHGLNMNLFTSEHDEGILEQLNIVMNDSIKETSYNMHKFGCGASSKQRDNFSMPANYQLDTTQPANITIQSLQGSFIKGTFNFTLIMSGANTMNLPEKLVFTNGHFNTDYYTYQ